MEGQPSLLSRKRRRVEIKKDEEESEVISIPDSTSPVYIDVDAEGPVTTNIDNYSKNLEDKLKSKRDVKSCQSNFVGGHEVYFPFEPYPTQMVFMDKVLRAIKEKKNALLESPTGTGKSLSLLCSSLAWQQIEKERLVSEATSQPEGSEEDTGADVLRSLNRKREREEKKAKKKAASKCPKIFFGTRTHSQIAQLQKELLRTPYRPKMSILASREHYCIHPRISTRLYKNIECKRLNDHGGCSYKHNKKNLVKYPPLQPGGELEIWDIEDLTSLGEKLGACPYFAAKSMGKTAELVFCPYNYILDPGIRGSYNLDLTDAVVILDEAHNIEDACRNAASVEVEVQDLEELTTQLGAIVASATRPGAADLHRPIYLLMSDLLSWAKKSLTLLKPDDDNFEQNHHVWTGEEMVGFLQSFLLTEENFAVQEKRVFDIVNYSSEASSNDHKLSPKSIVALEGFFRIWAFVFANKMRNIEDFRLVMKQTARREQGSSSSTWVETICIWCLNPAVAFLPVAELARSVILTSGTLSPIETLITELGVEFPIRLEAGHVINPKTQVWASTISEGPGGVPFNSMFKNSVSFEYQDALGKAIVEYCKIIPGGVLCFFPSYSLLDRVCQRWHATNLWNQLNQIKQIVLEPKKGGEGKFEEVMNIYYAAIARTNMSEAERKKRAVAAPTLLSSASPSKGGAIFLAVCRGKVSEGLDFADEHARAVIVVGIPYPHTKDQQVILKRAYNDTNCKKKHLLDGSRWYTLQAWRAVNQAVGRCIRHKDDYGAILLLDQRFSSLGSSLPRWIGGCIRHFDDFNQSRSSLYSFFEKRRGIAQNEKTVDFLKRVKANRAGPSSPSTPQGLKPRPALPPTTTSTITTDMGTMRTQSLSAKTSLSNSRPLLSSPTSSQQSQQSQQSSTQLSQSSQPFSQQQHQQQYSLSQPKQSQQPRKRLKPHTLYCKRCGMELADTNPLIPQPPKGEVSKEYFCLLVERMAKGKGREGEELRIASPMVEVYLIQQGMLNNFHCGAVPPEGLPSPLKEDHQAMQTGGGGGNRLSIWAPKDRLAYVPLFCKGCSPIQWVGVLVVAADTKNAQYLNQVWLTRESVTDSTITEFI